MKVIEGSFGKQEETQTASDALIGLAALVKTMEDDGEYGDIKVATVLFAEAGVIQVLSNDGYPDSVYTLLAMGQQSIMHRIFGIEDED